MAKKTYPINAQIEVIASEPPIYGMQVQNLIELTTLSSKNSYLHKIVWVISEKIYYYLSSGNGTNLNQWLPVNIGGIFEYQNKTYQKGESVIVGSKVYIALDNILEGQDPINSPDLWLVISEVKFTKQNFENSTEVTITTPYDNPTVIVYNMDDEIISAFITVNGGIVNINVYPQLSGYVIVKE